VLGSILGGVATPTEAASVGAAGALLLGGLRLSPDRSPLPILAAIAALAALAVLAGSFEIRPQRSDAGLGQWLLAAVAAGLCLAAVWGLWESLRRLRAAGVVGEIATRTMTISAMIFGTIIGASVFSLVFRGLGGDTRIEDILAAMPGGADGALVFVMVLIFVLGFFLDFVEISIIVLPIVGPTLMLLGHDPIWLSVLIAVNLQTSFLTPPFGFSLFYLRGAAPKEISTAEIYRGVAPFVVLQIVGVALIWMFPAIATTLPRLLFG
jgi:TRAP-type mannitol/chloroaromatic compound transport system permease large subunit